MPNTHGKGRTCTSKGFGALKYVRLTPRSPRKTGPVYPTREDSQQLRKLLKTNSSFPSTSKFGVRKKKKYLLVTISLYPHNLVGLGGLVAEILNPSPEPIRLPFSVKGHFDTLLSKEAKRVAKAILAMPTRADMVITVNGDLWWDHLVKRYRQLGIEPLELRSEALSRWRREASYGGLV
jgi:hypothetical protein